MRTMYSIRSLLVAGVMAGVIAGMAIPGAAAAQTAGGDAGAGGRAAADGADPDPRWLPWMGCWRLWEEQVDRGAGAETAFPDRTVVCVTPAADSAGARLTARADGAVLVERTLVADGARRDIADGDCRGWERRDWSADGRRLFTRAELRCGDDDARRVNGISLMSNRSTWVDIQNVTVGTQQHLEIRRYNPAADGARPPAPLPASPRDLRDVRQAAAAALTLPAVREAVGQADSAVVEAMLVETEPRLPLDGATLVALDDAGVDGQVIDLLVALAYPERFVVERRQRGSRGGGGGGGVGGGGGIWGSGLGGGYVDPVLHGALSPYYLTPFGYGGYGSWGGHNPYLYNYGASPFVSLRNLDAGADQPGRVVNGLGYTRVRERTAVAVGGGGGGTVGSSGGGRVGRPRSTGATSSGGRATPGGYTSSGASSSGGSSSSSGGGGGGGRTAVPR